MESGTTLMQVHRSNKNIELNIIIKIVGINIIAKINQIVKEATINTLH